MARASRSHALGSWRRLSILSVIGVVGSGGPSAHRGSRRLNRRLVFPEDHCAGVPAAAGLGLHATVAGMGFAVVDSADEHIDGDSVGRAVHLPGCRSWASIGVRRAGAARRRDGTGVLALSLGAVPFDRDESECSCRAWSRVPGEAAVLGEFGWVVQGCACLIELGLSQPSWRDVL